MSVSAEPAQSALEPEQRYLERARADLALMRARTLSLKVQGGDRVSSEYLAASLHRRAAALLDDAATTLFFGRTDHSDGERWYIGRRHVADANGDPVVIDWRADVSRAFYRASRTAPLGVVRRRRFGVEGGRITAYEDEDLSGAADLPVGEPPAEDRPRSAILAREIERPRVGPMRDIVATIQPEQDEIVRADVMTSVCVQGAPGTGKTAVGLHRAAWLLYTHRDKLGRAGVLVVGPNASFLEHVAAVLPSLGEAEVRHTTVEALVGAAAAARSSSRRPAAAPRDPVGVAGRKGDARRALVRHRAVWSQVRAPAQELILPRGSRRLRLPAHQVADLVVELTSRGVRYGAARDMLPQRLSHALLVLMEDAGDSPDDRVQDTVARSREVRRYVDEVWPALAPQAVLFRLLTDPGFLAGCAQDVLDADEQARLLWRKPPRSAGAARWSAADAVLLDELGDLLRRTPSLGHVVLDEAQDLSPMQLRAVGRRCSTGSMTVLGDLAQGTTAWATPSWEASLAHLGHPDAVLEVLDRGFRVPRAVIEFAARLLPAIAPGMGAPTSIRDDPGSLEIVPVAGEPALWPALVTAVRDGLAHEGSIGVIVPDDWVGRTAAWLAGAGVRHLVLGGGDAAADGTAEQLLDAALEGDPADGEDVPPRVSVVPATTAKGLEYDRVVVAEPAAIAQAEPDLRTGLRRLYVVLTRAVSALTVVHHRPLPELLRDPD